jgi:TATA-binding protein-associated factor Taf7
MTDKERLTRRQLHALPFLISNPTVESAAKQSGVSAKQIFGWLNQSAFRKELENRKNEVVNQAVDRLKVTASKACDTLIGLLDHAESESVQYRVAVDMLNMTLKYMEFKDVEQRIRKLEDTITE